MEDRYLILFKEIIAKRILEGEINLRNPRRSILSLVVEFREIYGFSIFSKFEYNFLALEFLGMIKQYAYIFGKKVDIEKLKEKKIPKKKKSALFVSSLKHNRSSWADYHEKRAP